MKIEIPIPNKVHELESIEYELSPGELLAAHTEQQRIFDMEDVASVISDMVEDNLYTDEGCAAMRLVLENPVIARAVADRKRHYEAGEASASGTVTWRDCTEKAIEDSFPLLIDFAEKLNLFGEGRTV